MTHAADVRRTSLRVDAVLFDMDGTLVDESASYCEAIRLTAEYLLRAGVTMDEENVSAASR